MIVNIDADRLAIALSHNKLEKKYEDLHENPYINNYDEFRGLVMHDIVKETYDKIYNKYLEVIMTLVKEKEKWQS